MMNTKIKKGRDRNGKSRKSIPCIAQDLKIIPLNLSISLEVKRKLEAICAPFSVQLYYT